MEGQESEICGHLDGADRHGHTRTRIAHAHSLNPLWLQTSKLMRVCVCFQHSLKIEKGTACLLSKFNTSCNAHCCYS